MPVLCEPYIRASAGGHFRYGMPPKNDIPYRHPSIYRIGTLRYTVSMPFDIPYRLP